jgi:hypothetical protein
MSIQHRGGSALGSNIAEVGVDGLSRVVTYGPDIGSLGGRFRVFTKSGALAAIAANNGTNGLLWALRNGSATSTKLVLIERIRAVAQVSVLPSAAQEFGINIFRTTAHTVNPAAGGAAVAVTTPQTKLRVSSVVPEAAIYFANSTTQLTAGTHTLDTLAMDEETGHALVAGADIPKNRVVLDLDLRTSPLVLAVNEGLVIGNAVLEANSLAYSLAVACQWREVPSYGQ